MEETGKRHFNRRKTFSSYINKVPINVSVGTNHLGSEDEILSLLHFYF